MKPLIIISLFTLSLSAQTRVDFVGQIKNKPFVDVRSFGAIGDAKLAIDPAFQSVINFSDCWMNPSSAILNCANSHFSAGDVGKVIAVYDAGLPGAGHRQPLASTIQSVQSGTQITLANSSDSTINLTQGLCTVLTASWTTDGNVAVTCNATHNFAVGQTITFWWTDDLAVDGWEFSVSSITDTTHFVATGNGFPDGTHTFGSNVNGNPVICSGRSPRVVWGTNNTTAIQAAVDSRAMTSNDDQTGAEIYFPPGHYLTNGIITDCTFVGYNSCTRHYQNYWFHGAGRDVTVLENWDPNQCLDIGNAVVSRLEHCGVLYLGSAGNTLDGSGSFYYHYLHFRVSGLSLIQTKNPTAGIKALFGVTSENSEIFDNFISNYSYEALYIFGKFNRIYNNSFRYCGLGGPAAATGISCMNTFGWHMYVYNNRAENFGLCTEATLREGVFANNWCSHVARKGTGFSIGSDPNGVWNMIVTGNVFENMATGGLAFGSSGGNGTMDRLRIVHNTFINSPGITLGDSSQTNSPGFNPDLNPTNASEFSHNTLSFPFNYGGNLIYGVTINTIWIPWIVDSNTFDRQFVPLGSPGYTIDINVIGNEPYWKSSTSQTNGDYRQRVRPRPDNDFFLVTSAGTCTTGSSEPSWVTTTPFTSTTSDNTCTWTYQGKMPVYQLSNNRIGSIGTGGDNGFCAEIALDTDPERIEMTNNSIGYKGGCLYLRTPNRPRPVISGSLVQQNRIPANTTISDSSRSSWYTAGTWADVLPVMGYYKVGQKINKYVPSGASQSYWIVTREGFAAPIWAAAQAYSYMDLVVPSSDNGHFYAQVVVAGCTSGGAQPAFPTTIDNTVGDNTCTWREVGTATLFSLSP